MDTEENKIEELDAKISELNSEIERIKRVKQDSKDEEFRTRLKNNISKYDNIIKENGDIEKNFDINILVDSLKQIRNIKSDCDCYDDDPYSGSYYAGPRDTYKENSSLYNKTKLYEEELKKRILYLFSNYKWKMDT